MLKLHQSVQADAPWCSPWRRVGYGARGESGRNSRKEMETVIRCSGTIFVLGALLAPVINVWHVVVVVVIADAPSDTRAC